MKSMFTFTLLVAVLGLISTSAFSQQKIVPNGIEPSPQKFEGREGIRALLAALRDNEVPAAGAEVTATPLERIQGSLDALSDCASREPAGAAAALTCAVNAINRVDSDLREATAASITTTYESWVVVSSGVEEITVPEWTEVVMGRTGRGKTEAAAEAILLQIDAEQRIDRLRNPGWGSAIAWWWSR